MNELNISESAPQDASLQSTNISSEQELCHILRDGSKAQIFRALLREYFGGCSIQGCKYFSERRRHWSERVFWMIMFSIAIGLSSFMITKAWKKWDRTPVIVTLSEKSTPVWNIPFPAVTICPEVKAYVDDNGFNFNRISQNKQSIATMSEQMLKRLKSYLQLCNQELFYFKDFGDLGENFTDASVLHTIYDMSPKTNMLSTCKWYGDWNSHSCFKNFRTILTEDGICLTFNALNSEDIYTKEMSPELLNQKMNNQSARHWKLEDGYDDSDSGRNRIKAYPYRVLNTGPNAGLEVTLSSREKYFDYKCRGFIQGYKVILHSPAEIPQPSKNFFYVPPNKAVLVSVKPNMIEISKELEGYAPARKQCFLNAERKLRFFKIYTQRHCELECLANYTLQQCGCVLFSHPRDKNTSICGIGKLQCAGKSANELAEKIFLNGLNNDDKMIEQGCFCLPACTSITYETEISQSKIIWKEHFIAFNIPLEQFSGVTFEKIRIYFKESEFIASKRSEFIGSMEFLAACGGLVGLFIGVTALSLVEILYYFTLRMAWTLRMYRCGKSTSSSNRKIIPNKANKF